jgi:cytochrome c553
LEYHKKVNFLDPTMTKRLAIAAFLIPFLVISCSEEKKPESAAPAAPPPPADAEAGKQIAEKYCFSCHGLDGLGTAPDIPHLAGQKEAYLVVAMGEYGNGTRGHAALQELVSKVDEAGARNVAAWYAAQKPPLPKPAASQTAAKEESPIEAGRLASAACVGCHGPDGNGSVPGMPSLAGLSPAYLAASMNAYKKDAGTRTDPVMGGFVAAFDKATIESIALFYATQKPKSRGPATTGDAATGEPLSGSCGACHGQKGVSTDPKTPSLAGQDPGYLVKAIKAYRDGARNHETMKGLVASVSDTDAEHLAAFYAAQEPKGAEVTLPLTAKQWAERCDRCHNSPTPNPSLVVPIINAQRDEYLVRALIAYRDGKRKHSTMHVMGAPLSDSEIHAIAAYYASLPH